MGYGPEMFMDARCNHVSEKPGTYSDTFWLTPDNYPTGTSVLQQIADMGAWRGQNAVSSL
jgi:hypothetical protein